MFEPKMFYYAYITHNSSIKMVVKIDRNSKSSRDLKAYYHNNKTLIILIFKSRQLSIND